jgi:hypothetical protein
MLRKLRLPSPALVVAVIALFVALGGTAVAAGVVPLAKRAMVADNAKKLGGRTTAQIGQTPGPASTASSLISVKSAPFSLPASGEGPVTVTCDPGQKALAGGFTTQQFVLSADSAPTVDGGGWSTYLINFSDTQGASGTVFATCLR